MILTLGKVLDLSVCCFFIYIKGIIPPAYLTSDSYQMNNCMITSFSPNFSVFIGVYLINNVVIVSGGKLSNSTIHIHVSILPQTPLPSRLPHNIEQSSLCYTVGPCALSVLNITVNNCMITS